MLCLPLPRNPPEWDIGYNEPTLTCHRHYQVVFFCLLFLCPCLSHGARPGFWSWLLFPFEHLSKGACPLPGATLLPSALCLHPALPHDLQTHIFCCSLCIFIKMSHRPVNIPISFPVISCWVQISICYSVSWSGSFRIFQDMMPSFMSPM